MKKISAILLILLMLVLFAACGASAKSDGFDGLSADNGFVNLTSDEIATEQSNSKGEVTSGNGVNTENEKIIKTVYLNVQTKEYDKYISALKASVTSLGGYVESSESNMGFYEDSNRYANYVVRIPAEKLEEFITSAGENGKITNKSEEIQNVTLEYVDLESRIDSFKAEKETLTGLLKKAESLENVLAIQERLSEVNYQIDSYTSQLNVLKNRVSFSTVTLNINEVERVSESKPTLWSEIKDAFSDNIKAVGEWLRSFVVGFVGGLPIIIPIAAVAVAVILIIRKAVKKRKEKRNILK
ncbi:MAG: DUF4349 domain-containing protein [Acutalibacteraceae bacterium]